MSTDFDDPTFNPADPPPKPRDPADHPDLVLLKAHGGMLTRPRVATAALPIDQFPALARSLRQQGLLEAIRVIEAMDPPLNDSDMWRAAQALKRAAVNLKVIA